MRNQNIALYITIAIATAGCANWSGPRGTGHSTPVEWTAESNTAFRSCITDRREQRHELLCDAGLLTGSRCAEEVAVGYRDSVQLICDQSDAREAAGESRTISDEECERLLASDGVPADAVGTVSSTAPATADPRMQWVLSMNPGLWQDDHSFCIAITSGYGAPTAGGVALGAPVGVGVPGVGVAYGAPVGVGLGVGTTVSAAMTNIVLDARGMRPGMIAVVTISGTPVMGSAAAVSTPMTVQVTPLMGAYRVSVPDGLDYNVTVQCMLNGSVYATGSTSECFSSRYCGGGQVDLDVICGRG